MSPYDIKFLHTVPQEPVTYKAVSQISYFTIYGLHTLHKYISTPTYTLSLANVQKHPHTCTDIWPHMKI